MSDVTLRQAAATSSSLVTMISALDAMQSELLRTLLKRLQTSKQTANHQTLGRYVVAIPICTRAVMFTYLPFF